MDKELININVELAKYKWPTFDGTEHSEIIVYEDGLEEITEHIEIINRDGRTLYKGLPFTHSLDACDKFLIPDGHHITFLVDGTCQIVKPSGSKGILNSLKAEGTAYPNQKALALCRALIQICKYFQRPLSTKR